MKKAIKEPKIPLDTTLYHPKLGAVPMTKAQAEKVMTKLNRKGAWSREPIKEDLPGAESQAAPVDPVDEKVTDTKANNGPRGNSTKGKAQEPDQESGNSTGSPSRGED